MIYTCYEMIRDCREDRAEGWAYFIANYVPVVRKLLAHYQAGEPAELERVVLALRKPESNLFQSQEPAPGRWFVAVLRQKVLAELTPREVAVDLDLETVAAALEPLTMVERQVLWLEGMLYSPAETGVLLRMDSATAEKIRAKGADLIRGKVDSWSRTLLAENGLALGREAAAAGGEECLPPKTFLDMLDGRTSWRGRQEMEQHVTHCWHCLDHFCRLVEVAELVRDNPLLPEAEAEPLRRLLGVQLKKPSAWKRLLAGKA